MCYCVQNVIEIVPLGPFNNKAALVRAMAWYRYHGQVVQRHVAFVEQFVQAN